MNKTLIIYALLGFLFVMILAEIFIDGGTTGVFRTNGEYGFTDELCDVAGSVFVENSGIRDVVSAIDMNIEGRVICKSDGGRYAFYIQLPETNSFWCADSTGFAGEINFEPEEPSCL